MVRVSPGDYEQQYLQAATLLDSTKNCTAGYWTVTVIKAGYFSTSSSGNSINYLRIDMQVTLSSLWPRPWAFSGLGSLAVSSPHAQYQFDSADSTLNIADRTFDPGFSTIGYWIFQVQGTLDPLNTAQLTFTGGMDNSNTWLFQL
jgi:hypothetical protein